MQLMGKSRNNKCTCGSGVKFKKCCMEVFIEERVVFSRDFPALPVGVIKSYSKIKDIKDTTKRYFKKEDLYLLNS